MEKLASITIDIDPAWVIGEEYWGIQRTSLAEDVVYNEGVYNFLNILDNNGIKGTFFIVAGDLLENKIASLIKKIADSGHEIANHTIHHYLNFASLSYKKKKREVELADKIISDVTGQKVEGFRAPGYYIDDYLVEIIDGLNYSYDTSILPSYFTKIMMIHQHLFSKTKSNQKTIGKIKDTFSSLKPYILKDSNIYEFPISVIPVLRLPFHFSFVQIFGKKLFDIGLSFQKMISLPFIYVFHGADLVKDTQQKPFSIIPASKLPFQKRLDLVAGILKNIKENFNIKTMSELVNDVKNIKL